MTRAEAVRKAEQCFNFAFEASRQEWFFTPLRLVAALENLGMLKLDEPKSAEERAIEVLKHYVPAPHHVIHDLALDGLKIVEK